MLIPLVSLVFIAWIPTLILKLIIFNVLMYLYFFVFLHPHEQNNKPKAELNAIESLY